MSSVLSDVKMTVSAVASAGVGDLTLLAAYSANDLSMSAAGAIDGRRYPYLIEESGVGREEGLGTYHSSGTTFSRDTVEITSAGNQTKLTFSTACTFYVVANKTALDEIRSGGATATTTASGFSLTHDSTRVQSIAFTALGQSITLPDATGYSTGRLGAPIFAIHNTGSFAFGVRRSDATILCVLAPGGSAVLTLEGNGSATGPWRFHAHDERSVLGALTIGDNAFSSTYTATGVGVSYQGVALTDTLSLFAIESASATFIYAVDTSTYPATFGTPVQLDSVQSFPVIIATSATTAVALWNNSTTLSMSVIGVSGTTVTVNTAATKSTTNAINSKQLQGQYNNPPTVVNCGQYFGVFYEASNVLSCVPCYYSGTSSFIGNVVTFGSAANAANYVNAVFSETSSTCTVFYLDDSGTTGTPFSVRGVVGSFSGTTTPVITFGTSAGLNDATAISAQTFPVCSHGGGLYTLCYPNTSGFPVAVGVTISGTTVTFGTPVTAEATAITPANLTATSSMVAASPFAFSAILHAVSSTVAVFSFSTIVNATPSRHAVLTNAAGAITLSNTYYGFVPIIQNTANSAHMAWPSASVFVTASSDNNTPNAVALEITGFTISGTTMTRAQSQSITGGAATRNNSVASSNHLVLANGVWVEGTKDLKRGLSNIFYADAGGAIRHLGGVTVNAQVAGSGSTPQFLKLSPTKFALQYASHIYNSTTVQQMHTQIWEVPTP